jgi:hypothetical protein
MVTLTPPLFSQGTLHLLAAFPSQWHRTLQELKAVWKPDDQLLLIADGAQGWADSSLHDFGKVGMLQSDAQELPLPTPLPDYLVLVSPNEWSNYVLAYPRCLMWR